MSNVVMQNATYEDLMRVPEHRVAEIIDGTLYSMPRPAVRHANASSMLGGILTGPFRLGAGGPGGWTILDEPELHMGIDVIVPDIAGWRRERMPTPPDVAYIELAPDWVCEVLSPGTWKVDRTRKMRIYAREGVGHLWFIDPIQRTLEIFRQRCEEWVSMDAFSDSDMVRAEPFDAIEIRLSILWLETEA